ncbi:MAG TPA: hypothetical protein VGM05_15015 [Planctomycetaceae bacterium]|jgi:hypothetical protein
MRRHIDAIEAARRVRDDFRAGTRVEIASLKGYNPSRQSDSGSRTTDGAQLPGLITMFQNGFNFKLYGGPPDDKGLDFGK